MKLTRYTDTIWTLDHFLTPKECAALITFSEQKGYKESIANSQGGSKTFTGIRHSYKYLHYDTHLAKQLWKPLKSYCDIPEDNSIAIGIHERFRFYKYQKGHRFDRHYDTKYSRNNLEESKLSFVIYLNEEFEGGETQFDTITITPKAGMLLCFPQQLMHAGTPILSGIKYIIRSEIMYRLVNG